MLGLPHTHPPGKQLDPQLPVASGGADTEKLESYIHCSLGERVRSSLVSGTVGDAGGKHSEQNRCPNLRKHTLMWGER